MNDRHSWKELLQGAESLKLHMQAFLAVLKRENPDPSDIDKVVEECVRHFEQFKAILEKREAGKTDDGRGEAVERLVHELSLEYEKCILALQKVLDQNQRRMSELKKREAALKTYQGIARLR